MNNQSGQVSGEVLELRRREDLLAIEPEWRALTRRATAHTLAQTFPFALTAYEMDRRLRRRSFVVLARRDGVWAGVMGLSRFHGFHSVLKPFSCGTHEEYCDPPLDPANAAGAARALVRAAATINADRLMLYNLRIGGPFDEAVLQSRARQSGGAIQAFVVRAARFATHNEIERAISGDHRRKLNGYARKLSNDWPDARIAAEWLHTVDETLPALEFVIREKRLWLERTGKRSNWVNSDFVSDFLTALGPNLDLARYPFCAALRVDRKIIAAAVCFQTDTTIDYFINAYDEEFKKYSPTKLLLRFLLQYAMSKGRDFDFCVTLADYKKEWPVEIKDCVTRTVYLSGFGRITSPREAANLLRKTLVAIRNRVVKRTRPDPFTPAATDRCGVGSSG